MFHHLKMIDLVKKYTGIVMTYDKKSLRHFCACPFCHDPIHTFSVDNKKGTFFCFSCGIFGDRRVFLEHVGAIKTMIPAQEKDAVLIEIYAEAACYYYRQLTNTDNPGADYIKSRGLSNIDMSTYGLGFAPDGFCTLYREMIRKFKHKDLMRSGLFKISKKGYSYDFFRNRVMFPILDERRNVIAFGGRIMDDGKPKYINSPETELYHKRNYLYGFPYEGKTGDARDTLILCEGYFDYIMIHRNGFDCAATLGTAVTPEHANLISAYYKKVCLALDSDNAGIHAAKQTISLLKRAGLSVTVAGFHPYKDPDECLRYHKDGRKEFKKRIESALPAPIFCARYSEDASELIDILMQQA